MSSAYTSGDYLIVEGPRGGKLHIQLGELTLCGRAVRLEGLNAWKAHPGKSLMVMKPGVSCTSCAGSVSRLFQ